MTISGYSNTIVDIMLGWLKGLANWVLRLFNLAGRVSTSPLLWLSQNWLKLLILFLVLGVALDGLIWLIRWRPYWVWFRTERVIVNDDKMFINADIDKADDMEGDLAGNWDEHDYVVASTVVRRQSGRSGSASERQKISDGRERRPTRGRSDRTKVTRHASQARRAGGKDGHSRSSEPSRRQADAGKSRHSGRHDNIFAAELNRREVADNYEDEVFNVTNLPVFDDLEGNRSGTSKKRRRRR